MSATYQAIGFDYAGVIVGGDFDFMGKMSQAIGVPRDVLRDWYFRNNFKINVLKMSFEDFWRDCLQDFGVTGSATVEQVRDVLLVARENDRVPNRDVIDLMRRLRADGYTVGILTNAQVSDREQLPVWQEVAFVDAVYISEKEGYMKPDPRAFRKFADMLGVQPNELIFIDDTERSLSTAAEVGYTPILFRGYDTLVEELRALGVQV